MTKEEKRNQLMSNMLISIMGNLNDLENKLNIVRQKYKDLPAIAEANEHSVDYYLDDSEFKKAMSKVLKIAAISNGYVRAGVIYDLISVAPTSKDIKEIGTCTPLRPLVDKLEAEIRDCVRDIHWIKSLVEQTENVLPDQDAADN